MNTDAERDAMTTGAIAGAMVVCLIWLVCELIGI